MGILRNYLRQAKSFENQYGIHVPVSEIVRYFPDYRRNMIANRTPLQSGLPLLTYAAIRYMGRLVTANARVFEYGCGGSTLFFAARAGEVVSVEHDALWHGRVLDIIRSKGYGHCHLKLVRPAGGQPASSADPSDPCSYASASKEVAGLSFKDYVTSINEYPDRYFDLVLIDGRARPACFQHSLAKVKNGGHIIWDNTERAYYFTRLCISLQRIDFPGPVPGCEYFGQTTVFSV